MKKLILCICLLSTIINGESISFSRSFIFAPQLKFGKIENGNGFAEIQYFKIRYDLTDRATFFLGASTGFTSNRKSILSYNHAVNRMGYKFIYLPLKNNKIGVFFEGSFTEKIIGNNNDVSYLVYDTYQAVGVRLEIKQYDFTFEKL